MPSSIWPYLTALLYVAAVSTSLAIAQALERTSHDRVTRMLWGQWSRQTLLELALRPLFKVVGGDLMVAEWKASRVGGYWRAAYAWSSSGIIPISGSSPAHWRKHNRTDHACQQKFSGDNQLLVATSPLLSAVPPSNLPLSK